MTDLDNFTPAISIQFYDKNNKLHVIARGVLHVTTILRCCISYARLETQVACLG